MVKKILITGGAGFIGSEFVRLSVSLGYYVVVIDKLTYAGDLERLESVRDKYQFYQVDIVDREGVEKIFNVEKPDFVVHFAAESHVDRSIDSPDVFMKTNVMGTMVMLEMARKYEVSRFVNISTDEVYGDLDENGVFTLSTPLNPSSPYSVSKAAADMLGRSFLRTYDFPVLTVRPSNNYGPWQYPEKLIPLMITKVLNGEKVPVYGNGKNVREWLFVEDSAKGIMRVLERGEIGGIYNLGGDQERDNLYVVNSVLKLLGKDESSIEFVKDRLGHDFRYALDSSETKKSIAWEPEVKFEDGIERTVKWNLDNKKWLSKFEN
ncbi:MAG: dTDP-glucose 4,6-dehydratase [Nanoarchaeota archaeon]|nr:dTDP-glucose 4,6-dehydratase [Nanoarchaeota archaeon]